MNFVQMSRSERLLLSIADQRPPDLFFFIAFLPFRGISSVSADDKTRNVFRIRHPEDTNLLTDVLKQGFRRTFSYANGRTQTDSNSVYYRQLRPGIRRGVRGPPQRAAVRHH